MYGNHHEIIDVLLEHCHITLNFLNDENHKNVLLEIEELIEAGRPVNSADDMGMTPLHVAITYSLFDVAQVLIKAGADINAQDNFFEGTPLHHAVKIGNPEAVCLLLYYGADVNVVHRYGMTPFMHALDMDKSEIAWILFDYYDDFPHINKEGYDALLLATMKRNPIAVDLVKGGTDVNYSWRFSPLVYSVAYDSAKLFKLIWSKLDFSKLINNEVPFFLIYLQKCRFSLVEWLECIYIILMSPAAFDFVNDVMSYIDSNPSAKFTLFSNLLLAFHKKKVSKTDRMIIIHLCLSLGAEAEFNDIVVAYRYYGFDEELTALIYVYNNNRNRNDCNFLLPIFILANEEDYNFKTILELLKRQILYSIDLLGQNLMVTTLKYFALPCESKTLLVKLCEKCPMNQNDCEAISRRVKAVPEIASLVELSRHQVRIVIKQYYNIQKPYQFIDAVRNLQMPQLLKDIICFRKPIYN